MRMYRQRGVRLAVRVLVSLALYAVLLRSVDGTGLLRQLDSIDWRWVAVGIVLPVVGIFLSALRWQLLLEQLGVRRTYRELLLRYWSGAFYNTVLPGSVSGDVVRLASLLRSGVPMAIGTLSVLGDRLLGLAAALSIGLVSCLLPSTLPYRDSLGYVFGSLALGGLVALCGLVLLRPRLPARIEAVVALVALPRQSRWALLSLAAVFQASVVLHLYSLAHALHLPVTVLACGIYMPAVVLSTLLPISINGIGVRESALVLLLGSIGVSNEAAILLGLFVTITSVGASLPGGLAMFALPHQANNDRSIATL